MKLPIKKKYFDEIKDGSKIHEYRDAHITFVCEETGEKLTKRIDKVEILDSDTVIKLYPDVIKDKKVFCFYLK